MTLNHDRRLVALGKLVSNASAAELHAANLLAGFVEDEVVGRALVADMAAATLAQKLQLLSRLAGVGAIGTDLAGWAGTFNLAMEERNKLVHATWGLVGEGEGEEVVMRYRGRGKGQTPELIGTGAPVSLTDYEAAVLAFIPLFEALPTLTSALSTTGRWYGSISQTISENEATSRDS